MPNISDITGYTWVGMDFLNLPFGVTTYNVNFVSNNTNYSSFTLNGVQPQINYNSTQVYEEMNYWSNNAYKTVIFIDGDDIDNVTFISWLEANGTLTPSSSQLSVDLTTLSGWSDVSAGNHTLKVKAKAAGYRDSALSAGVSFTKAASGYSGNISAYDTLSGNGTYTKIKFDAQPISDNDYDSYVNTSGILTGLTAYSNKTKVYVWGSYDSLIDLNNPGSSIIIPTNGIKINNDEVISGGSDYSTSIEVALTGDYTISLVYHFQGGSND
ncbi:MAG: hypothetical protein IJS71_08200 [Clostridia bacterium]|nr:hypothetical protein [Clostridia bacterium]